MREGRIIQADAPLRLLSDPVDPGVATFLGEDRTLRSLALIPVTTCATPGEALDAPAIAADASLKDALALLLARGAEHLAVSGSEPPARVNLDAIRRAAQEHAQA